MCRHRSCAQIAQPPAWKPTLFGPVCPGPCPHRSCAEIRIATTDPAAPWRGLRRWAHRYGYGGHFFTKSRKYTRTFGYKRQQRIEYRRAQLAGPEPDDGQSRSKPRRWSSTSSNSWAPADTTADAILANTSAALAREHEREVQQQMAAMVA